MKKVIIAMLVCVAAVSVFAATTTNEQGQIIYSYTNYLGQQVSAVVGQVSDTPNPDVIPVAAQLIIKYVDTDASTVTPLAFGCLLMAPGKDLVVGASTGTVAIATGLTTSDWVLLD